MAQSQAWIWPLFWAESKETMAKDQLENHLTFSAIEQQLLLRKSHLKYKREKNQESNDLIQWLTACHVAQPTNSPPEGYTMYDDVLWGGAMRGYRGEKKMQLLILFTYPDTLPVSEILFQTQTLLGQVEVEGLAQQIHSS